jgi:hypothetical protein
MNKSIVIAGSERTVTVLEQTVRRDTVSDRSGIRAPGVTLQLRRSVLIPRGLDVHLFGGLVALTALPENSRERTGAVGT